MAVLVDFSKVAENEQEVRYAFGYPTMDRALVITKATKTGRPLDDLRDRNFTAVFVKIIRMRDAATTWPDRGAYMA